MSTGARTRMVTIAVVAVVAFAVAVFVPRAQSGGGSFDTVGVRELANAIERGTIVIDVREPFEHATGVIDGALLIPLADVVAGTRDIPKDAEVHVVCRSGNRSVTASQALVDAGFENVVNVGGGMIAWEAAGLPIVR